MSEIAMMLAHPGFDKEPKDDTPADGYGAGYLEHSIRRDFRDLCRIIGKESARQEVAEIINAEFERKVVQHV